MSVALSSDVRINGQDQDQDQNQEILLQLGKTSSPKTTFQGTQNKNIIHTQMGMRGKVIDTKTE